MILTKTYKFKLYRTKKNKQPGALWARQMDLAGCIYNHCIALHRRYYRLTGKSLNAYALMKHLAKLKKLPKYAVWNRAQGAPGSQAIQDVVQEEVDPGNPAMSGHSAGFDFGLRTFLTASDGGQIESPLYYRQALDDLRTAQRKLSRKVKFSHNWHKAKANVARIYRTVVNRRRDWFFKLAHELTDRYDYLFFEDLAMRGMQALWGRKVGDLARSEFMGILAYVASTKGKTVRLVNRFYPSSKTCADCGHLQTLKLSDPRWVCDRCGAIHDRDHNAAVNILREGASSLGLGDVRPPVVAIAG